MKLEVLEIKCKVHSDIKLLKDIDTGKIWCPVNLIDYLERSYLERIENQKKTIGLLKAGVTDLPSVPVVFGRKSK